MLITTRTACVADAIVVAAGEVHQTSELGAHGSRAAAELFLRGAGLDGAASTSDIRAAEAVVKCVGCLSLAVSQAASFMKVSSHMGLDDLMLLYRSKYGYEVSCLFWIALKYLTDNMLGK